MVLQGTGFLLPGIARAKVVNPLPPLNGTARYDGQAPYHHWLIYYPGDLEPVKDLLSQDAKKYCREHAK